MIELQDLSVGYGARSVLRDVSMPLPTGKVTAILGPNGCGKSTLLRTVAGLQTPIRGKVLVDGVPSSALTSRQMAMQVTYFAQSRNTPNILARRMVLHGRFPYVPYPRRYSKADYEMVDRALALAGAEHVADSFMDQLSGGERQKIYLAMALAQDTKTILMDEPTTFLDVGHQRKVLKISRRLASEGKAVVLVLHDVCEALRRVDEIVLVADGALAYRGSPEDVFATRLLDKVFGVELSRFETEDGWQYYCR